MKSVLAGTTPWIRAGILAVTLLPMLTGCKTLGPRTLKAGRVRYNAAIQHTNNQQMLLNLVRLRYSDTPFFLQVASLSTAFEFYAAGSLGMNIDPTNYSVGTGVLLSEQPTITYTPLQGEQFVKSLLTPVDLSTLILLYHSGWAIDRVLRVCVQEMNDVPNAPGASGPTPAAAPEFRDFLRAVRLLRALQKRGEMSLAQAGQGEGREILLEFDEEAAGSPDALEFARLLGAEPGLPSYRITSDLAAREPDRIRIVTRSLMATFFYVSQGVAVPPADEEAGRVTITQTSDGARFDWREVTGDLLQVHQAAGDPDDASVSTHYRDRWFYIADADLQSEATFALLMQLFSLQSGNVEGGGPILTLPVTR